MELIALNYINNDKYIFLKKEDLFVNNENNIKEEILNIDEIKIDKLNELFNSGSNRTKNETFKENIEYCKKFIHVYNDIGNRQIPEKNIKTLRGVYRALYVNKVTYKRLNTYSMSKNIIDSYEKLREYNIDNVYDANDREKIFNNIWNDIHKKDENLKEHHCILGNAITNEILLEEFYGYDTINFKCKFMQAFNKLSLLIFYKDCPGMNSRQEDVINALENIRYYFDKVMAALIKFRNDSNPEEEA